MVTTAAQVGRILRLGGGIGIRSLTHGVIEVRPATSALAVELERAMGQEVILSGETHTGSGPTYMEAVGVALQDADIGYTSHTSEPVDPGAGIAAGWDAGLEAIAAAWTAEDERLKAEEAAALEAVFARDRASAQAILDAIPEVAWTPEEQAAIDADRLARQKRSAAFAAAYWEANPLPSAVESDARLAWFSTSGLDHYVWDDPARAGAVPELPAGATFVNPFTGEVRVADGFDAERAAMDYRASLAGGAAGVPWAEARLGIVQPELLTESAAAMGVPPRPPELRRELPVVLVLGAALAALYWL